MSAYILFVALKMGYGMSSQAIPMATREACESAKVEWLAKFAPSTTQAEAICLRARHNPAMP